MTGERMIHKVRLDRVDLQVVTCDEPLSVGMQDDEPTLWFASGDARWKIHMRGTGHTMPRTCYFLGTVMDGRFVWHFFMERAA